AGKAPRDRANDRERSHKGRQDPSRRAFAALARDRSARTAKETQGPNIGKVRSIRVRRRNADQLYRAVRDRIEGSAGRDRPPAIRQLTLPFGTHYGFLAHKPAYLRPRPRRNDVVLRHRRGDRLFYARQYGEL